MRKLLLLSICYLFIFPVFAAPSHFESGHLVDTAYRLKLSTDSTPTHPTYFKCTVSLQPGFESGGHPTLKKWTPQIEFTPVVLVNYAQNVKGFNGLGIINTTAGYINSHYFMAYHDPDFKNQSGAQASKYYSGFIDAHVLWAGYQIQCNTIDSKAAKATRVLAGSDYN